MTLAPSDVIGEHDGFTNHLRMCQISSGKHFSRRMPPHRAGSEPKYYVRFIVCHYMVSPKKRMSRIRFRHDWCHECCHNGPHDSSHFWNKHRYFMIAKNVAVCLHWRLIYERQPSQNTTCIPLARLVAAAHLFLFCRWASHFTVAGDEAATSLSENLRDIEASMIEIWLDYATDL